MLKNFNIIAKIHWKGTVSQKCNMGFNFCVIVCRKLNCKTINTLRHASLDINAFCTCAKVNACRSYIKNRQLLIVFCAVGLCSTAIPVILTYYTSNERQQFSLSSVINDSMIIGGQYDTQIRILFFAFIFEQGYLA